MNCGTPNCKRQVEFNDATEWAPEGWWTHTDALPGTFVYLECFPTGQGPYAVANLAPPAPAPAGPAINGRAIPAADDIDGDPVLFTQARAVELLAEYTAATSSPDGDPAVLRSPRWIGAAASIMSALLIDAGVTGVNL